MSKETYPLKQFDEVYGMEDDEAQKYGPGAFCWDGAPDGNLYLWFLTPRQFYMSDKYVPESVPVTGPQAWQWDGSKDNPNIHPSIQTGYTHNGEFHETFHGYVRDGVLEIA